jgi:hypothetical protein
MVTVAKELSMSKTTVWRLPCKRLVFKPYRIQMVHQLSDEDYRRQLDFCLQLQDLMSSDDHFLEKVQFSDEATFHVSGGVNLEYHIDVCRVTRGAHIKHL